MDRYLTDLIHRMLETSDQKQEPGYDSSKTISWIAFREAEKLGNADLIPQLTAFIDLEKNKKKRQSAYFILGHLAKNTHRDFAAQYLIRRIDGETDKYILSTLLNRIADLNKPAGTDLTPIVNATKSEKWLIRHSAIQALKNSNDAIAEDTLIEILENSDDPHDLAYANATLSAIGTPKAIPNLEKQLNSRKRDVRLSAQRAIEAIRNRT